MQCHAQSCIVYRTAIALPVHAHWYVRELDRRDSVTVSIEICIPLIMTVRAEKIGSSDRTAQFLNGYSFVVGVISAGTRSSMDYVVVKGFSHGHYTCCYGTSRHLCMGWQDVHSASLAYVHYKLTRAFWHRMITFS